MRCDLVSCVLEVKKWGSWCAALSTAPSRPKSTGSWGLVIKNRSEAFPNLPFTISRMKPASDLSTYAVPWEIVLFLSITLGWFNILQKWECKITFIHVNIFIFSFSKYLLNISLYDIWQILCSPNMFSDIYSLFILSQHITLCLASSKPLIKLFNINDYLLILAV